MLVLPLTTSFATQGEDKPYEFIKTIDPQQPVDDGYFGGNIAMSGDRIIVGEYGASRVHIYDRDGVLVKTLKPPSSDNKSQFGSSVAVFGEQIVVGETLATVNGLRGAGLIHFYDLSGNLIKTIQSPNPLLDGGFGFSTATDGERLVVSEPGPWARDQNTTSKVYILDKSGSFTQSFDRPQLQTGSFGWSLGIHGNILVVSEPYAGYWTDVDYTHGIVHIYHLGESAPLISLKSPIGLGNGNFGYHVSIGEDVIAVGEVRGDANGTSMAGTAHLYSLNGTLIKTMYPATPRNSGYFGIRVYVSELYVAVNQAGYIYLYDHLGNPSFTISEENLISSDFGFDLVVDRDRLAAGVQLASVGGKRYAGEVYLYQLKIVDQDVGFDIFPTVEALVLLSVAVVIVAFIFYHRRRNFGYNKKQSIPNVQT